jgi:lysophospholipase L1-like esterase
MAQRKGLAVKLALALGACCAALGAAELGLRLFHPVKFMKPEPPRSEGREAWVGTIHRPSATPGIAYELAPNVDQDWAGMRVRTNSLGLRSHEPLAATTPGLFRILAVGDSVTFGYRVQEEEGFASLLEPLLAGSSLAAGRTFEVLDVGVSGYSTRDELAAFEGKWLALRPQLVLVNYCINDPEIDPMQPLQRVFVKPAWWQHSQLLRFFAEKRQNARIDSLGNGNYFLYLHAPGQPAWQSVADSLARFGELARRERFALALVIFPMFSPKPWKDYLFRDVHARVAAEARSAGFAVLDLLPRFESEDPQSLLIEPTDSHPNALGHRIAAEEIEKFLEATPELFAERGVR